MGQRVDAILFDFDGTLLSLDITLQEVDELRQKLTELFQKYGISQEFRPLLSSIRGALLKVRDQGGDVVAASREAYQLVDDMELKGAENPILIGDVKNVLAQIKERGLDQAIVSNNGRKGILKALKQAGIDPSFFSTIITRDDVEEEKPSHLPVLAALKQLSRQGEKKNLVFVGDQPNDMRSGKSAEDRSNGQISVVTVFISDNIDAKESPKDVLIDHRIQKMGELSSLLGL